MSVATLDKVYEGTVENGVIRLPDGIVLPEKAVFRITFSQYPIEFEEYEVSLPSTPIRMRSPRLVHPEQAKDLAVEFIEDDPDANL